MHLVRISILLLRVHGGVLVGKEVLAVLERLELLLEFVPRLNGSGDLLLNRLVFLILSLWVVHILRTFVLSFGLRLLFDFFHRWTSGLQVRIIAGALNPDVRFLLRLFLLA